VKTHISLAQKPNRFLRTFAPVGSIFECVRAAREVMSPNVCRIFDLIEIGGIELVSMEYVDGATLLCVLQERGPLDLKEAQDIASQFLAGLEVIHKVGLLIREASIPQHRRDATRRLELLLGIAIDDLDPAAHLDYRLAEAVDALRERVDILATVHTGSFGVG